MQPALSGRIAGSNPLICINGASASRSPSACHLKLSGGQDGPLSPAGCRRHWEPALLGSAPRSMRGDAVMTSRSSNSTMPPAASRAVGGRATSPSRPVCIGRPAAARMARCTPGGARCSTSTGITFVHPEEFAQPETEVGASLSIDSNAERIGAEMLRRTPRDAGEIRRLAAAVRGFTAGGIGHSDGVDATTALLSKGRVAITATRERPPGTGQRRTALRRGGDCEPSGRTGASDTDRVKTQLQRIPARVPARYNPP